MLSLSRTSSLVLWQKPQGCCVPDQTLRNGSQFQPLLDTLQPVHRSSNGGSSGSNWARYCWPGSSNTGIGMVPAQQSWARSACSQPSSCTKLTEQTCSDRCILPAVLACVCLANNQQHINQYVACPARTWWPLSSIQGVCFIDEQQLADAICQTTRWPLWVHPSRTPSCSRAGIMQPSSGNSSNREAVCSTQPCQRCRHSSSAA